HLATTHTSSLSLHDALPICSAERISLDGDVSGTLRRASQRRSRAGVSLRPASTLAGFSKSSADAIGITLVCDDASDAGRLWDERDRKSTRLNSSHEWISYAV